MSITRSGFATYDAVNGGRTLAAARAARSLFTNNSGANSDLPIYSAITGLVGFNTVITGGALVAASSTTGTAALRDYVKSRNHDAKATAPSSP